MRIRKFIVKVFIIIALLVGLLGNGCLQKSMAGHLNEPDGAVAEHGHDEAEPLNVGELIIGHVVDAHEWHFMTLPNGESVAIYLPMILFHKGELYCFSSKHLYHSAEHSHQGFELDKETVVYRHSNGELSEAKVYDFSITKVTAGIFISCISLVVIFLLMTKAYIRNRNKAPKGFWNLLEMGIFFVRDNIAKPSIGKRYEKYMPYLLTAFLFIFFNNLIGQIPGWPNVTGNIAITLTLALFTFVIVTVSGNRHYWKEVFNPDVPLAMKFPIPLMPFIEFIGVLTKPFALTMRLFASITAGHIVMLGFICLIFLLGAKAMSVGYISSIVSVSLNVLMFVLELLIAFIQAFVFTLLSALYIGLAIAEPHHKESH
jgi:F-type H+-transporting ATPase subunit a